mmetsp:Transcript_66914/g.186822  ORF Transcript_66914/g.186822 Transcript_66914/m.186822 type:complete len:219 (-) Transcript_66914:150-806(-)
MLECFQPSPAQSPSRVSRLTSSKSVRFGRNSKKPPCTGGTVDPSKSSPWSYTPMRDSGRVINSSMGSVMITSASITKERSYSVKAKPQYFKVSSASKNWLSPEWPMTRSKFSFANAFVTSFGSTGIGRRRMRSKPTSMRNSSSCGVNFSGTKALSSQWLRLFLAAFFTPWASTASASCQPSEPMPVTMTVAPTFKGDSSTPKRCACKKWFFTLAAAST